MHEIFEGERRNGEDRDSVSTWTFTDKGVEIQRVNIIFIPYTKIVCFSVDTYHSRLSSPYSTRYCINLHIPKVATRGFNESPIFINFNDSDYGKSCVEKIKLILQTKIG